MSDYKPITENGRFKAAYIEPHNPHQMLEPLTPKGRQPRVWQCSGCKITGSIDAINDQPCTAPQPEPCAACGLTPICARDCPSIREALGSDSVYVIDGHG